MRRAQIPRRRKPSNSLLWLVLVGMCSVSVAEPPAPYANEKAWREAVPEPYRQRAAFGFVEDDPALPNVLLIGDSVSIQYTRGVQRRLADVANVYRAPANCRSTRQTRNELEMYLGDKKWDLIHFNWGIHDVTHVNEAGEATPPPEGHRQVRPEPYRRNLRHLVERLQKTDARLIWASTTPIGRKSEHRGYRRNEDVVAYNKIAADVMKAHGIPTNDLYGRIEPRAEQWLSDGVHLNGSGKKRAARAVARAIRSELRWFREDLKETPPAIPVEQKHLAHPQLKLHRLGPGAAKIKRSHHGDDPHYIWSGRCPGRWAVTLEHKRSRAALGERGVVRWRTKQSGDRVLHVMVRTDDGWLVSDRGTAASKDWTVDTIRLAACKWFRLDAQSLTKGERVTDPDLGRVRRIGFTDLKRGGGSKACSRLDWIEVYAARRPIDAAKR